MPEEFPPPAAQSFPSRIGRYRILARVGRGAMGVVYSALDEGLGRTIALKVLIADLEADPQTRARFYREAQASARLLHPNIITVYDAGEEHGRSFIAMQLLQGAPLATYLKPADAVPLERKLDLMIQVCEGLAAAHAEGIIHRDLKPNNLFVESDGLLKILDFGVARFADSSMTAAGTMLGTPDYMSPEQARGAQVDARSDIFSAGAVFYFMLSGHKPFPGPDLPAVLHQLQHQQPEPLTGVPPALAAIVSQAMEKDPNNRPARVEHLLASLVRFRRQYQSETRRLAFGVRARFEEVERLTASLEAAAAVLRLPDPAPGAALQRLRDEYPSFSNRATTVDPGSFERATVTAVVHAVDAERDRLAALLEARRAEIAMLNRGEAALAAGDSEGALQDFEHVLSTSPASSRARELAEASRPLARDQRRRAERVTQLLDAARTSIAAEEWSMARERCEEVLALEGGHPLAAVLLAEAERGLTQERRRIEVAIQHVIHSASDAIDRQAFDEADAILREADLLQRDVPAVATARRVLANARAAAEAQERVRALTAQEIRRVRSRFRRGRYEEAVAQLTAFMEREPAASAAAAELQRLQQLKETISEQAGAAQPRVRELLAAASAADAAGRLDDALAAVRDAIRWDPTSAEAAGFLDDLLHRQVEARISQERARAREQRLRECAMLVTAAREALQRGYPAIALQTAQAAQRIAPDHPEIALLLKRAEAELAAEDEQLFALHAPPWPGRGPQKVGRLPQEGGMLDWAADLLRTGLQRRK
jgi:serine/threonine protein kinase